jgi:hypothetical protein
MVVQAGKSGVRFRLVSTVLNFAPEQLLGGERRPSSLEGQPVVAIAAFWLPQRYELTFPKRARNTNSA